MAHSSSIFNAQPKRVPNRNGFDLSHVHSGTSKTGQLVPVLTKLLIPNSTISLGVNAEVNLPPLVSPFFGKVDFCIEGFVVPLSILYAGFKQFISNNEASMFPASQDNIANNTSAASVTRAFNGNISFGKNGYLLPFFNALEVARADVASFNSLAGTNDNIYEYMGASLSQMANFPPNTQLGTFAEVSMLPGLAYHRICDVFYRNTKLTKTWFEVNPNWVYSASAATGVSGYSAKKNVSLIWHSWYNSFTYSDSGSAGSTTVRTAVAKFGDTASLTFPDNVSFFSTRQRCYTRDYFTSAVQSPQQGGSSTLRFSLSNVSGTDPTGEFTINALRMANSLQKFLETNNLSGDYAEQMRNRWGVRPIDADFDEPHYLGRVVVPVYQHTLYQNNQLIIDGDVGPNSKNPFVNNGTLGAKGGSSEAHAEGSICDNFTCTTWAYLMVLASLVPHANYNYGNNKELFATHIGDFPAPELQGVGMEPIQNSEVYGYAPSSGSAVNYANTFGYTQRYARWKYMDDRVSGELKPGKSLQYFQLQRNFSDFPQLGTDFVTIAQDALDGVLTVSTETMKMTCWWEIFFKFHVIMPLAEYCIPTLGEMPDTHEIKTTQGGSRL